MEEKKLTQKERLLERLRRGPLCNYEIHERFNMFQAPTRIHELKKDGHNITGYDDEFDKQKYWYKLLA